ncbi:MAG: SMC-Scp complex subunit ScpB [Chloroflexia bacterium]|nr:SMC-Scp complex subunit ScpB [Chloroflexia bacterium]
MTQNGHDQQAALDIDTGTAGERAAILEALLFARGEAEEVSVLATALGWTPAAVHRALDELGALLNEHGRGIVLQRDGTRAELVSAPRFGALVQRMLMIERTVRLSPAALETLAIVAYRQPVTRPEIEAVRGVDSSGVLSNLAARDLVETVGRRNTLGNPHEYATTAAFLNFFGLSSLEDLPAVGE